MLSGDCESFALTKLVWNSHGLQETVYKIYSQRDQMKTNQWLQHFNINLTTVYDKYYNHTTQNFKPDNSLW